MGRYRRLRPEMIQLAKRTDHLRLRGFAGIPRYPGQERNRRVGRTDGGRWPQEATEHRPAVRLGNAPETVSPAVGLDRLAM